MAKKSERLDPHQLRLFAQEIGDLASAPVYAYWTDKTLPVNGRNVRHADLIFTMTQAHRQAVVTHWPDAAERTYLLCGDHVDVADPIV